MKKDRVEKKHRAKDSVKDSENFRQNVWTDITMLYKPIILQRIHLDLECLLWSHLCVST